MCKTCKTKSIVLNTRLSYSMATGKIDDEGARLICALLPHGLPYDWDYSAVITGKGEYVGTIGKRIAKYYKVTHKIKLSNDLMGKIGSIAGAHTEKTRDYDFDFVNRFNWQDGDFGDSGSCYWGGRSAARPALENAGAYAIRFYDNEGEGKGRAWIVPKGNNYILFNGYGVDTITATRLFADYMGLSYRKIRLTNDGCGSGTVYINGSNGYLIGAESDIEGKDYIDMHIECEDDCTCSCCGDSCCEESSYSYNGGYLCESCYCDSYFTCEHCGEVYHFDDSINIHDSYYCESCAKNNYSKCEDCGEWFDSTTEVDGKDYCENCLTENCNVCEDCGEWFHNDYIHDICDKPICESCRDENYFECKDCGEWFHNDDKGEDEEGEIDLCEDCFHNLNKVACKECGDMTHIDKLHDGICGACLLDSVLMVA